MFESHRQQLTAGGLTGRALTHAANKRRDLDQLYRYKNARATPWQGTAHGVLQAVNTYEQLLRPVRGTTLSGPEPAPGGHG